MVDPKTFIKINRIIRRMSVADPHKSAISIRDDLKQNYEINIHVSTVKICMADGHQENQLALRIVKLKWSLLKYTHSKLKKTAKILWND